MAVDTKSAPSIVAKRQRVLVVDDEAPLRRALERLLRHDFDVTTASSATAALELLGRDRGAPRPFALLITDLQMPERDGLWLLHETQRLYPSVGRVLISAVSQHLVHPLLTTGAAECFVPKLELVSHLSTLRLLARVCSQARTTTPDRDPQ